VSETLSIKISSEDKARLKAVSEARKTSISALLRESLRRLLDEASADETPSCYQRFRHLFEEPGHLGSSGLGDLATNKAHLDDYGR